MRLVSCSVIALLWLDAALDPVLVRAGMVAFNSAVVLLDGFLVAMLLVRLPPYFLKN